MKDGVGDGGGEHAAETNGSCVGEDGGEWCSRRLRYSCRGVEVKKADIN